MKKITFLLAALLCGAWCATAQTTASGHEWVDLGLPSGTKWATCNVGATAPEEYGDYFAWGETTTKTTYNWTTYKWCNGTGDTQTKYCNQTSYGKDGFTDEKTVLDPEDDAARANRDGAWRMPTNEEWTELRENCTWTWTTLNGKNGYEVKSRTNDNSIFLPAAGYRSNDNLIGAGNDGYYRSSSLDSGSPNSAWVVYFRSGYVNRLSNLRYRGLSVRPVINAAEPQKVDLGLPSGTKWADCNIGAAAPEEYGDYYAWGETAKKDTYSWDTYQHGTSSNNLSKYNTTDGKTMLDPEDDAARANWGGAWRMPTDAEWTELRDNCTWTWTTDYNGTGVAGRIVTSKTNGNSIFLPAAGYRNGDGLLDAGLGGAYWSGSLYTISPNRAWLVDFYSGTVSRSNDLRYYGQSVRPVIKENGSTTALQPAKAAINVYAVAGRIVCEGEFRIYDLLGRDVTRLNGSLCGVYVVKTGETAVKIAVK